MPAQSQRHALAPEGNAWANQARHASSYASQQPIPSHALPFSSKVQSMAPSVPLEAVSAGDEPSAIPTFSHVSYFTAIQLETLYDQRRGARMSASTWQTNRDLATGFIQSVASRLGFPQRTTATAQQIYQRFHLFYPPSDFLLHEIAVASLFVAAKLNDTHKKPRDILLASYALRYPQLVRGASTAADAPGPSASKDATHADEITFPTLAGQKRKHAVANTGENAAVRPLAMAIGSVAEADIDPALLEGDRKRLLGLEKLILECLCFNFHSNANATLKMVIKLGRKCDMHKSFIRTAWKIAADLFRTPAPLQYPPNVIAAAALYAAALLARPPARSATSKQAKSTEAAAEKQELQKADPITAFLTSIRAVSASTTPMPTGEEGPVRIPLSESAPQCDPTYHILIEDVEESVHELLDLYLACAAQLPPSIYMASALAAHGAGGSAAATPSPMSPADPIDAYNASPSSSAGLSDPSVPQPANARRKLKQYEYSPPPFGLVEWLNSSRCSQLQSQVQPDRASSKRGGGAAQASADPTLPTKELSALLTDLKIYLRGIEYDRQRSDDAFLAELGILAQVNVVPHPAAGVAAVEPASVSGGAGGAGAKTVAIQLEPINGAGVDALAKLDDQRSQVVKRIQRRKLVSALRVTFVEPEVEKRPPSSHPAIQSVPPPVPVADGAQGGKRNRIENAKRYLF